MASQALSRALRQDGAIERFGYDAEAVEKRQAEAAGGKKKTSKKKKAKFRPGLPGKPGSQHTDTFGAVVAPMHPGDLANVDLTEIGAIARGRSTDAVSALSGAKDQKKA